MAQGIFQAQIEFYRPVENTSKDNDLGDVFPFDEQNEHEQMLEAVRFAIKWKFVIFADAVRIIRIETDAIGRHLDTGRVVWTSTDGFVK